MKISYQTPDVQVIALLPQNGMLQASTNTEQFNPDPNLGEWDTFLPIF